MTSLNLFHAWKTISFILLIRTFITYMCCIHHCLIVLFRFLNASFSNTSAIISTEKSTPHAASQIPFQISLCSKHNVLVITLFYIYVNPQSGHLPFFQQLSSEFLLIFYQLSLLFLPWQIWEV